MHLEGIFGELPTCSYIVRSNIRVIIKAIGDCILAKKIEDYLVDVESHRTSLDAYLECPATTFLIYVNDAHDAFQHCMNKFTKKQDGNYHKDSKSSLENISSALFATIMGHFETYQKSLFAGLIDRSVTFENFKIDEFLGHLKKGDSNGGQKSDFQIDATRMLSLRGAPAQVGYVISESVGGWQQPRNVNKYFNSLGFKRQVYSNDDLTEIAMFWQLRHSIVHTGAWLTKPDAQKIAGLSKFSDKPIIFNMPMINWFCRRLTRLVCQINRALLEEAQRSQGENASNSVKNNIKKFLEADAPKKQWMK